MPDFRRVDRELACRRLNALVLGGSVGGKLPPVLSLIHLDGLLASRRRASNRRSWIVLRRRLLGLPGAAFGHQELRLAPIHLSASRAPLWAFFTVDQLQTL